MAVGLPLKTTYADGDVFSASDINDTNGTINLVNPTAKGSIVSASAANTPSRLAVGANNTVLIADSAETTGLKWGGGWAAWTPTLANITLGNGTVTARYQQIGKTVNFNFVLVLGSTSAITGAGGFSLPANNKQNDLWIRGCVLQDTGVGAYAGAGILFDNYCYFRAEPANIAYVFYTPISATVPHTWGNTDFITINGSYEVA
jgi:hypothetical protein